jgi:hypothetical protein
MQNEVVVRRVFVLSCCVVQVGVWFFNLRVEEERASKLNPLRSIIFLHPVGWLVEKRAKWNMIDGWRASKRTDD